jgi:hypothetical protein
MAMVGPFAELKLTMSHPAGPWFTLTDRTVTYNKVSDTSKLRITYTDSLAAKSSAANACFWAIIVDGIERASFSESDVDGSFGWRNHNGAHVAWVSNLPAGPHIVRVDNKKNIASVECSSGTNARGNFLSVEEIP